jgi:hypothetical protein
LLLLLGIAAATAGHLRALNVCVCAWRAVVRACAATIQTYSFFGHFSGVAMAALAGHGHGGAGRQRSRASLCVGFFALASNTAALSSRKKTAKVPRLLGLWDLVLAQLSKNVVFCRTGHVSPGDLPVTNQNILRLTVWDRAM